MNPDVPSLEACKRLAKAGYPQTPFCYAYSSCHATDVFHVSLAGHGELPGIVAAPTIGEMLAYIRQRKWSYIIRHGMDSELCEVEVRRSDKDGNFPASKANSATHEEPKEALANALSEAVEEENTK